MCGSDTRFEWEKNLDCISKEIRNRVTATPLLPGARRPETLTLPLALPGCFSPGPSGRPLLNIRVSAPIPPWKRLVLCSVTLSNVSAQPRLIVVCTCGQSRHITLHLCVCVLHPGVGWMGGDTFSAQVTLKSCPAWLLAPSKPLIHRDKNCFNRSRIFEPEGNKVA